MRKLYDMFKGIRKLDLKEWLSCRWRRLCNRFRRWTDLFKFCRVVYRENFDYDFEYGYLLALIQYKLKRMREHFVAHGCIEKKELAKMVFQIERAELALDRFFKDEYFDKYEAALTKKYGPTHIYKSYLELMPDSVKKENNGSVRVLFRRDKETFKNTDKIRKETLKAYDLAEKDKQRDLQLFCDILVEHVQSWWD